MITIQRHVRPKTLSVEYQLNPHCSKYILNIHFNVLYISLILNVYIILSLGLQYYKNRLDQVDVIMG